MLSIENTVLLVIDVQGKLAKLVQNSAVVIGQCAKIITAMQVLQIPVLHMEQNPSGLGKTTPELAGLLRSSQPYEKITFNGLGSIPFKETLARMNRKQVLLCGIEAHISIYQTGIGLLKAGYEVNLMLDAVSSPRIVDKEAAIQKLILSGAMPSSVEMAIYELLGTANHSAFKSVLQIMKSIK